MKVTLSGHLVLLLAESGKHRLPNFIQIYLDDPRKANIFTIFHYLKSEMIKLGNPKDPSSTKAL